MMFLGVFLLIGLAAADHAWAPGKVFTYKHKHEVKLGYPSIAAPEAPAALTADVIVQAAAAGKYVVKLADVSAKGTDFAKYLAIPFAANIKAGMVKSLEVSPALPPLAINILKAKMSVLNLNLVGAAVSDAQPAQPQGAVPNAEKAFFTVYEETHFGLCQASYAISALPAHLAACKDECMEVSEEIKAAVAEHLLVTKIVDAHKCKNAAIVAHVMPPVANLKPYAPAMNALYTRVVTTQYIIHGDRTNFLVKDIKHVEKVALNPLKGETAKLLVETISSFKLAAIAPAAAPAALPFAPKVVASVVSEIVPILAGAVEAAAITEAPMKKLLPIHKSSAAVVAKVVALLAEIVADAQAAYVDPEAKIVATKFLAVEGAIHFLDFAEIIAVYEKAAAMFAGAKYVTAKAFLVDACAMAGTGPCVAFIKKLIVEGKVPKEQAAVVIMTLPMNIKAPTAAVIKELHGLVHVLKTVDDTLYATALLAVSNVVYHHCVKPTYIAAAGPAFAAITSGVKFCAPETPVVVEFVNHAAAALASPKAAVKVAAAKALANTAHPLAVEALKPIVLGAAAGPAGAAYAADAFLRIHAITSLHRVAECQKGAAIDLLMGVFVNLKEAHAVRIAAATVVLANHPHHHILAKLAVTTWYEPSVHVHTFIHTALKCLSIAKLPVDPMVNHAAKAALALCKPHPALVPFSFHAVYADYVKEFNVGAAAGASVIGSATSLVPKFVHSFFVAMEGYPAKKFEASFAAAGVEEAIMSAVGKQNVEKVMDVVSSIHPAVRSAWKDTMSKLMVQDKFEAVEPVKAAAWFRIHDAIEAAFVLDGADGVMEKVVAFAMKAAAALKAGVPVNIQKTIPLVDTMVIIPTEVGYPAQVRIAVPFTISIQGSIKAALGAKPAIEAVIKPVVSAAYHAQAAVFGFPTETVAAAGIIAHVQVAAPPVKVIAVVDPAAKAAEIKVVPAAIAVAAKVIHVHIAPYVAYEPFANIINPVTALPSFKAIKRAAAIKEVIAAKYVKAMAGLAAFVEHETDTPLASLQQIYAFAVAHYKSPLSVAVFPYYLLEKVVNYQKLNVAIDFTASPVKEFKFVTKYFATVAKEVEDSWAATKAEAAAPAEAAPAGIWSMLSTGGAEAAQEAGVTAVKVQTQKPYGAQLAGAKVHNIKIVASCVGPATALVYEHVIAAAVTPCFKLAHVKYVAAIPAIAAITPAPYKVIVEVSVANLISKVEANAKAAYGQAQAARAPESLRVKAKIHKSEAAKAEEAQSGVAYFDSVSAEVAHSSGALPAGIQHVVKAVEHALTFAFYPYMAAEYPAQVVPGKLAIHAVVYPKYKIADIIVKKAAEIIAFKGIPVPAYIAHVLPVPVNQKGIEQLLEKANQVTGGLLKAKCVVDAAKVVTFDGVKIPAAAIPVGKEVLLAKFAGAADSAAISLIKKAGAVVVKVAKAGHVIQVQASAAGVAVAIDGAAVAVVAEYPVAVAGVVVAKIVPVAGGVAVVIPIYAVSKEAVAKVITEVSKVVDITQVVEAAAVEIADKVIVTKDAVVVKVTPLAKGKMVGVCGNFNGEKVDDMDAAAQKQEAQKAGDYTQYYKSTQEQPREQEEAKYLETVSKKIEKLFSKFTME